MPEFLAWNNQADADTSLAAAEVVYGLPYTDNDYLMNAWAFVTKSDTDESWGFPKPQVVLGVVEQDLLDSLVAGYTETQNRPGNWVSLLYETFSSGDGGIEINYPDWSVVDEGTVDAPSDWTVNTGELQQVSNIRGTNLDRDDWPKIGTYLIYDPSSTWVDYHIQLNISSTDDDALGIMFRYQDNDNYYRFSWDRQRTYRRIVKKESGVFTLIVEDSIPYVSSQIYLLDITVEGSTITVKINSTQIFLEVETTFTTGGIALYSWGNVTANFDNILITEL